MRIAQRLLLLLSCLIALPALADVSLEPNTDRMGGDYQGFALDVARPDVCRQACAQDDTCKAFSYVKPGVKGPQAMCFLKSSAGTATADECCSSGIKTSDVESAMTTMTPRAQAAVFAPTSVVAPGGSNEGRFCAVSCAASTTTVSAIGGRGTCDKLLSYSCYPNACDKQGVSCRTLKCNTANDCAAGAVCNQQSGQCVAMGNTCKTAWTVLAPDGHEAECSPYRCQLGACSAHCQNNGGCSEGYSCNVGAQLCVKQ